jgi:acyl carrier protein
MAKEEIKVELLLFVCRNFLIEEDEVEIDQSLVEQGIIDSFGLIEIAAFMKSRYDIATEESEMNMANFGSIVTMADYIERKKNG